MECKFAAFRFRGSLSIHVRNLLDHFVLLRSYSFAGLTLVSDITSLRKQNLLLTLWMFTLLQALMGSDDMQLRVLAQSSSDEKEKKAASKVLKLLSRGRHWVLVVSGSEEQVTSPESSRDTYHYSDHTGFTFGQRRQYTNVSLAAHQLANKPDQSSPRFFSQMGFCHIDRKRISSHLFG